MLDLFDSVARLLSAAGVLVVGAAACIFLATLHPALFLSVIPVGFAGTDAIVHIFDRPSPR